MINKIKQLFKQKHSQKAWQLVINQDRRNFLLVFGLFIIVAAAFFAVYKINNKAQAGWWNDTWQYRKKIAISSGSSAATNYQVLINDYNTATDISAGKMQTDCGDIRFTSEQGVELPYWIESGCNTSTTDIWVKVNEIPASGGTNIYMYYGNPSAKNGTNEDDTFIFADDFEQNDISKWTSLVANATNSVQQRTTTQKKTGSYGVESYQTGTDDGDTVLALSFGARAVIMEGEFYDTATLTTNETIIFGSIGFYGGVATGTSTSHYVYRCSGTWTATTKARSTGWHKIKIVFTGSTSTLYIDGTSYGTCSGQPTANYMQYGSAWLVTNAGFYGDNFFMREYMATEPTAGTPGSEEQTVSPIAYYSFDEGYGTTVHNQMEKNGEHGLTSYYKLDEGADNGCTGGSNDICDEKGLNDGTNSSATWGTGYVGSALTTNGSSTYFQIPDKNGANDFDYDEDFTVSFWVKTTATTNTSIVEKWSGSAPYPFVFRAYNSNYLYFMRYDLTNTPNVTSQTVINDGSWHHIVGKKEGSYIYLYVDGVLQNSALDTTTTTTTNSSPVYIGSRGGSSNWWAGSVDELKFYNRALTEQEIIAQYNSLHGHMISMDEATDWVDGAKQNPQQRPLGKALDFDGSNDQVVIPSVFGLSNSNVTISTWVYLSDTSESGSFVKIGSESTSNDGYAIGVGASSFDTEGNDLILLYENIRWIDTGVTIGTGWHHVAMTINGSGVPEGYIDGKSVGTFSGTTANAPDVGDTTKIGGYTGSSSQNRFGNYKLDEVKIYKKALTADQIKLQYNRSAGAVMGAGTHAGAGAAPKGFWKLDEGSGFSTFDSSGNNNTGILTNMDASSDWVAGKVGKALDFDGSDDYISVTDPGTSSLDITGALTASAWVKWDTLKDFGVILNKGTGSSATYFNYAIWSYASGKVSGYIGNGSTGNTVQSTTTFTTGTWYHISFIADGSNLKLYVNGSLDNTASQTITPAANNDNFTISQTSYILDGQIDHVKVYDYARTPEQIHYDMATGSPIAHYSFNEGSGTTIHNSQEKNGENGLVSWWKFDTASSGTISTAYDEKGVNNGTGYNATYSSTAKIGNSGYFYTGDASNDYITVGDNDTLDLTAVTISAWVRPTDVSGYGTILGKRDSASATAAYAFRSNNTQLDFYWKNSGNWQVYTTSDANLAINTWYYLTATYDGTSVKVYKNGVLLTGSCTLGTCNNALEITDDNLGIGWSGEMGSEFWDGYLDSVKLYNRALSAAEIIADYNSLHGHMINMDPSTDWVEGAKQNLQQRVLSKALDFDGSNDRVQIPYSSKLNFSGRAAFSVSAWINPKINNAYGSIVSQSDGSTNTYVMAMNSSGRIEAGRITAATGSTVIPTNKWSHVVFTYDGTYINVYVNATVDATPTSDINNAGSSDDLLIGAHNYTSPSVFFNGSIDEVKIYNYALTANEVKTEYNRGAAMVLGAGKSDSDTAENSLVGWWKLDEGSGYNAFDSSTNNNVGVLTNMSASSAWTQGKVGKALDFESSSSNYVNAGSNSSIDIDGSSFSIALWIKRESTGTLQCFLGKGNTTSTRQSLHLCFGTTDLVRFGFYGDDSDSTKTFVDTSRWYHLVFTYNASDNDRKIYVDGILETDGSSSGSLSNTDSGNWSIGREEFSDSNYFDGLIDDVKIWKKTLSTAEVAWEYNQGAPIYHWDFNDDQGILATNAQGKSVTADGLVGFWTLESVFVNDMSGNGNNLSTNNSPSVVSGIKGNALDYNGTNQCSYCSYINCPSLDYQGNGFTISTWVLGDSTNANKHVTGKHYYNSSTDNGGYLIYTDPSDSTFKFILRNSVGTSTQVDLDSAVAASTTTWQHVVGTYDGTTAKIYVNGVLKSSGAYTGGIMNTYSKSVNFGIATHGNCSASYLWDGKIDHTKVWQRALSAAEVAIEYGYDEKYGYLTNMDAASDWVNGALPAANRPMLGKALDFDGSNDYLIAEIPKSWHTGTNIGATGITYSAWIKTANSSTVSTVAAIGKDGGCSYACLTGLQTNIDGAGTISMVVYSGSAYYYATSNNSVADNQWHHVVGVYRTNHYMDLYVDGILQESVNVGSIYSRNTYGFVGIGANIDENPGPVQYFSGQIDEVKIYNYALTANQVKLDYNNSAAVRY